MPHCNEKLGGFQKVRCIRMKGHEAVTAPAGWGWAEST